MYNAINDASTISRAETEMKFRVTGRRSWKVRSAARLQLFRASCRQFSDQMLGPAVNLRSPALLETCRPTWTEIGIRLGGFHYPSILPTAAIFVKRDRFEDGRSGNREKRKRTATLASGMIYNRSADAS